jgi:two-component system, response regulator PdtaR
MKMTEAKILIVEDEMLIARDLEALLTDWGFNVVGISDSGEEAYSLYLLHEPDLMLVDIQLYGGMDGIELVQQCNAIKRVPFIYLTGQADHATIERAKATNPSAYLFKPFDEKQLLVSIELALSNFEKKETPQYLNARNEDLDNNVKLTADSILRMGENVFIRHQVRFVKFGIDELLYLEADRNHTFLVTKKQKFIIRLPLTTVLEKLNDLNVVRVHRSFAANVANVEEFSDSEIVIGGKTISLTPSYRDDFLKRFNIL